MTECVPGGLSEPCEIDKVAGIGESSLSQAQRAVLEPKSPGTPHWTPDADSRACDGEHGP